MSCFIMKKLVWSRRVEITVYNILSSYKRSNEAFSSKNEHRAYVHQTITVYNILSSYKRSNEAFSSKNEHRAYGPQTPKSVANKG